MEDLRTRITPEIVGNCEPRRLLMLVLGLVTFLLVANAASVIVLEHYPINRSNWLVREKWRLLDHPRPVDTLVLGDSSCTQAVRPDILEAAIGGRSLNLCTVGNMLVVNDVWMLDEYLQRHGRPSRVVIVHVFHAWNRSVDRGFAQLLGKIERPWMFWSRMKPQVDLDLARLVDVGVSRWLPLYGESRSLRKLLWNGPPRFTLDDRGFMRVDEANPKRVQRDHAQHVAQLATVTEASALSDVNRRALFRLRELAETHDLDVTIVPAPIYDELARMPALQERIRWVHGALRKTVGGSHNIRVVTEPAPTFREDEMENVDHVVGAAAVRYTQWLAATLTASQSQTRAR